MLKYIVNTNSTSIGLMENEITPLKNLVAHNHTPRHHPLRLGYLPNPHYYRYAQLLLFAWLHLDDVVAFAVCSLAVQRVTLREGGVKIVST